MNESLSRDDFIQNAVNRYSDTIFRVSYQYVRNRQDAEDVMQEVLLELVRYLHGAAFESEEHTKAWLIRVSINKSINLAKQNARRKKQSALREERVEPQYADLDLLLESLPAIDREVVYLHYFEGYSAREIGEMVGKTEKSVFKRLSRSRNKLKDYILEEGK